ncbi:MAG TPA: lysylphosphatidylglycerol synthase transmembrane domain-containing protein [Chloroflexota bacterium]|nr:lysylphosphatidylglycerol synthase transmembrane domain-containing protein [Chloroflexota bacterium]
MAKKKRVWLGLAVSLVCLWLVFRSLDPAALAAALARANFLYVLPAVAVYFVGVWLRSVRWKLLLGPALRGSRSPSTGRLFRVLVIGFTVNNLLPARLGELARAYLLWRGERVEPGATLATIVLERVLDGLTLCAFAGFAALLVPFPADLQRAAWATAALFLVASLALVGFLLLPGPFVALAVRLLRLLPARFAYLGERLIHSFVDGLAVLRQAHALAAVLGLSVLAWLAEATMYYLVMLGFPFPARPEAALLGAAAANFGAMIPSSPGYVGTFDLPLQIVLTEVFGVALAQATSYTLVLHAALVVPVVLVGLFFLWQERGVSGGAGEPPGHGGGLFADLTALTQPPPAAAPVGQAAEPPVGVRSALAER